MHRLPSHNSLWFLFARSLSGEITPEDEATLRSILEQDIALQQQYDLMRRMWHAGEQNLEAKNPEEEKKSVNHILELVKTGTEPADEQSLIRTIPFYKTRRFARIFTGIAASVVVMLSTWLIIDNNRAASIQEQISTVAAENGGRTRTVLPDGSTVWVNAGTHITYNNDFKGKTREVTLDGEAYFDVVKNPQKPFIVHVSGYDIKVLGTAFNVKSYADDKTIETTLLRGLVQVTKQGTSKQQPIMLHPNEKLILNKIIDPAGASKPVFSANNQPNTLAEKDFKITPLDSGLLENERLETAWIYNRLEFRGDSFEQLARKLERWYNVNIVFDDEHVKHLSFNGSFQEETIEQALNALKTADAFNYSINGNEIHIRSVGK